MKVSVRVYGLLRPHVPHNPLEVELQEGATVADLIDYMCQNYGLEVEKVLKPAEPARFPLMVIVNSKEVRDERERFVLSEDAVVDFLSPIAGG